MEKKQSLLQQRIKKLRVSQGLSQGMLAGALSVTSNYISMVERGVKVPSTKMLKEMAKIFKVDYVWLIGEEYTEQDDLLMSEDSKNLGNQFDSRATKSKIYTKSDKSEDALEIAAIPFLLRLLGYSLSDFVKASGISEERLLEIEHHPEQNLPEVEQTAIRSGIKKLFCAETKISKFTQMENAVINTVSFLKKETFFAEIINHKNILSKYMKDRGLPPVNSADNMQVTNPYGILANYFPCKDTETESNLTPHKYRIVFFREEEIGVLTQTGRVTKGWLRQALERVRDDGVQAERLILYTVDRNTWPQVLLEAGKMAPSLRLKFREIRVLYIDANGVDPVSDLAI